ncbi:hypothetical protein WN944_026207 [Citrus x changshan-huyou]|uniref:Uncharacterized protein n=1 Tax=Citrus x changshan-huyou TaxID=2935761 RepID=A0AAP0LTZ5_9ROSI
MPKTSFHGCQNHEMPIINNKNSFLKAFKGKAFRISAEIPRNETTENFEVQLLWLVPHPSPTMSRWRHSFLPTISLFQSDTLPALPLFDHVGGAQESRAWPKNGSSKTILMLQLQPLDLRE